MHLFGLAALSCLSRNADEAVAYDADVHVASLDSIRNDATNVLLVVESVDECTFKGERACIEFTSSLTSRVWSESNAACHRWRKSSRSPS